MPVSKSTLIDRSLDLDLSTATKPSPGPNQRVELHTRIQNYVYLYGGRFEWWHDICHKRQRTINKSRGRRNNHIEPRNRCKVLRPAATSPHEGSSL